jgi:hypothetical protein
MRPLPAIFAVALGGCGEARERCLDREFFRDRSELYHVARLADGYVIDAQFELVGYDDADDERFRLAEHPLDFVTTRDGRLTTLAIDDEDLVLRQWSDDGAALGEIARVTIGADARDVHDGDGRR